MGMPTSVVMSLAAAITIVSFLGVSSSFGVLMVSKAEDSGTKIL